MTTWASAAFFTTCAWFWFWFFFWFFFWFWFFLRRRLDLNALDSSTSFAVYFFLDLFRRATHHSDCHCVFLLVICLVLDFYCSLINIINPQNLVTSFGNKNNSNLALFLKIKIERLTRYSTQYFLDFLVAFFASKVNLNHHRCDLL